MIENQLAARLDNWELLGSCYAFGMRIADSSRVGAWGKGAIRLLLHSLQRKLRGFRSPPSNVCVSSTNDGRLFFQIAHRQWAKLRLFKAWKIRSKA
jgi:hypothetical protein